MPYKVVGKSVMVQKGGKWHVLHTHENHAKALAHYRALIINVPEARREMGITTKPKGNTKAKPKARTKKRACKK